MSYEEDEMRQYELLDTAFKNNLAMPTIDMIASQIFLQKSCSEVQSQNNLYFLSKVEIAIYDYVYHAYTQLDYKADNDFDHRFQCECDYDCECSLNMFAMSAFKNIHRKFASDIDTNPLLNDALDENKIEERARLLNYDLVEIFRVILHRQLAILAYDIGFYHISCKQHEVAMLIYGGLNITTKIDVEQYLREDEVLSRNYKTIGAKGGAQKGANYSKPKEKALEYHDQHFSKKNEDGKFIYSNDKASEKIIDHFKQEKEDLGYEVRSLSKHISLHRKQQFKD
ncbi:hypothetical protein [Psychrobacter sp. AOP7-C1-14]|uniref:hypothetical protein n=1 Tax=Psychrobacter sp. AOP7-C1-14 TaxID=3457640 RepID=UPI00402B6999